MNSDNSLSLPIPKPRIEFFDLAKGVCISLIMLIHMGIDFNIPEIEAMRVPLYYVLSGIFFKEYSSFSNFLTRKINKIIIPLFFFYLLSYVLNQLYHYLDPTGTVPPMHLSDLFIKNNFYNVALWFLLSLFWVNILFYFIHHFLEKEWQRGLAVIIAGSVAYYFHQKSILLPMFLCQTFTTLPFFYFGYLLKKTPLPYKNKYDNWNIPAAILLFLVAYLLPNVYIDLRINEVKGNFLLFYLIAMIMVTGLLLVCKQIKRLPVISYLGRYSIIVLGSHILLRDPFFVLYGVIMGLGIESIWTAWLSWISVIASMYLVIPFAKKYLPYVTAQKDLIPVGENKY